MPHQVEAQLLAVKQRWPEIDDFNLHLHNGRGVALASVYAALKVLEGPIHCVCKARSAAWRGVLIAAMGARR